MTWRQVAAGLPALDYPLSLGEIDELVLVAGDAQFELGLAGLSGALSGSQ